MQPPEGDPFYLIGEFREVDPPPASSLRSYREDPDPEDVETLAELSFRGSRRGRRRSSSLKVPSRPRARRELHRNGWTDSFDRLEQFISQR
jgi:hypothetical protein